MGHREVVAHRFQWATAVGGRAFREATGFARGPPPFVHPPPSSVACLDKTLVLGGSRQSKEMTHDRDFGNLDHKSPGTRFWHSRAKMWLSVAQAEAERADSAPQEQGPSAWCHSRPRELGAEGRQASICTSDTNPHPSVTCFPLLDATGTLQLGPDNRKRNAGDTSGPVTASGMVTDDIYVYSKT